MRFAYLEGDWLCTVAKIQCLFPHGHIAPFPIPLVLQFIIRINANLVEVLCIGGEICVCPGYVIIVSGDDQR